MSERKNTGQDPFAQREAGGLSGFSDMPSAPGTTRTPTSLTGVTDTGPDPSATAGGSGGTGGTGTGRGAQETQGAVETAKQTAQQTKEAAKETALETKDAAMATAQQVKGDVQAQASEVVGEAKQQASELMGQAKEQAATAFSKQQQQAIGGLGSLSEALRQTARQFKEADDGAQAGIGQFVEDAADRLAQSADFLRDKEPAQLLHDVQDFARKQPLLFVGAAFGVGLVAARMMKGAGGSAGIEQAMGSLSQQATQAMDTVKDRVSDMTGAAGGSGQSGQPSGSAASGSARTGSTASSPGFSGTSGMDETASDVEIERARGQSGSWDTDLAGDTMYGSRGASSGASAGYAPDVPAEEGRS